MWACFPAPGRSWLTPTALLPYGVTEGNQVCFHRPHLLQCLLKGGPVPAPFPIPSICFCALCQPPHAGNIISPGVQEAPDVLAGGLLWECTGPLHGADLVLLAAAPSLLLMHFSALSTKVGLLSGWLGTGLCLVTFGRRLSSSVTTAVGSAKPNVLLCWVIKFWIDCIFEGHGLDFPANIPGVMKKSSCFLTTVQRNPLQGDVDSKGVSWRSALFSEVGLSHSHSLQ